MGLTVTNNVVSVNGQNNLNRTSSMLNRSLERLSSGLKVNRGADGPAALVISEQQRAQITGLNQAIENTSKAISMVQTGEGALNEINRLLLKARGLALDSANAGVNDADAQAANQAEVKNLLDSIDRIANNTQFGTKKLLDGSAGYSGTATDGDVTFLKATTDTTTGTAIGVNITVAAEKGNVTAGTAQAANLAADETLSINGVQIKLGAGMDQASVISKINEYTGQTGVSADAGGAGGATRLITTQFGSAAKVTVQSDKAAAANSIGFGITAVSDSGVDVDGEYSGVVNSAGGVGDVLTGTSGAGKGLSIKLGLAAGSQTTGVIGAQGNVSVADNSLVFQVGANAGQTAKIALGSVKATGLGIGVSGVQFGNLSSIDIRTAAGAQDSIKVIDQAIDDVTTLRGDIGAFQTNQLEATASNLRTTLENTMQAESTIRDTDFAVESANFIKNQTLMQSGVQVLSNANQVPQLVLSLLR
jgi:flagellin